MNAYQPCGDEALERVFAEGNRTSNIDRLRSGDGYGPNWFRCADGTVLSVIAGDGTWCDPFQGRGPFTAVEVWWPGEDEPEGQVAVDRIRDFVRTHGGIVGVGRTEADARAGGAA